MKAVDEYKLLPTEPDYQPENRDSANLRNPDEDWHRTRRLHIYFHAVEITIIVVLLAAVLWFGQAHPEANGLLLYCEDVLHISSFCR